MEPEGVSWGDNPRYIAWAKKAEEAGFEVYRYRGRFYYDGPAANVDDLSEALAKLDMPCQWDNMGLGFVIYPKG